MLYARLKNWSAKEWQKETASEAAFVDLFFKSTWGCTASGEKDPADGYTLQQQFPVRNAGQKGGTGAADIALGYFGRKDMEEIPQVLGEFKDDRSGLDKPQANRPNDRSPVAQCLDYLREARSGLNPPILPTWGIVTDMNEFRLYFFGNKAQYQRFVIQPSKGDLAVSLLEEGDDGAGRTLNLTALARIFEQSITDLEVMEARAEGRKSLTELAKRKRDGVYYTPEWVTHYIVEETVGARLAEIREEIGFERFDKITDEQIKAYRANRRSKIIGEYKNALTRYQKELDKLKVVDPACGSGAFLIQAFQMQLRIRWRLAQRPKDINPLAHVHIYSFHMAL